MAVKIMWEEASVRMKKKSFDKPMWNENFEANESIKGSELWLIVN